MNRLFIILVLFLPLMKSMDQVYAQKPDSIAFGYARISGPYIKSYGADSWSLLKAPLHWKPKQWLTLGAIAGSGVLLYSQDGAIRDFVQEHRTTPGDKFFRYGFEHWGSGYYTIPLLGGLYFGGRWLKNDRLSATALTAGKAAVVSAVFVNVVKQAAHRHRPFQDDPANPKNWDGPLGDWHHTSFPSGHSTLAFSVAAILASEYSETVWVPALAYSLAAGTAFSRIYHDKHWASDVFIGSVFGWATGRFIWKRNQAVKVYPILAGDFSLLSISLTLNASGKR
ncbi:MAG TPA: phosphatase PAP2 family protein [Bacteroidales bacterium]|nr:phosphatase PAP2 family protein [Bacteroidales bacterium]